MRNDMKKEMSDSIREAEKKQYSVLVEETKPPTPVFKHFLIAFLVGGAICSLGQLIYALLTFTEMSDRHCVTMTLVILIFLGALFTGLGIYDKLGSFAGAGSVVPISGFANSVVAPAMEWKSEGLINGVAAKLFTIAGPVIVYSICLSVVLGLIHYVRLLLTGGLP